MSKKNRNKSLKTKKREPRLVQQKRRNKASWRNSWITSLIVIVLVAGLSIFWYISSQVNAPFESRFGIFTCELPDDWTSYDLDSTIQFDGNLGNCAHPHMFSPRNIDLSAGQTSREINLSSEQLDALMKSVDDPSSEHDKQLKEQISENISKQEKPKSREGVIKEMESLTVLTCAIFLPDTDPDMLKQYLNGIGGIDYPHKYFLEDLEKEGHKIPNVDYGFYLIREGGQPVGILKSGGSTVIFNGIVSEGRNEDVENIIKSIRTP